MTGCRADRAQGRAEVGEPEGLAKLGLLKESVDDRLEEAAGEDLLSCMIASRSVFVS